MSGKDFSKLNPLIGLVANNMVIGSTKMNFFMPDGSATEYVDIEIPEIQEKLTTMLSSVEGTDIRHLLIVVDNLKNLLESACLQGGRTIVSLLMDSVDIPEHQKQSLISVVAGFFNHMHEDEETADASQMLNDLLAKGKKPH